MAAQSNSPNSLDKACQILLDRDYHADYPPSSVPRKQLLPKRRDQCQATAPKVASISSGTEPFPGSRISIEMTKHAELAVTPRDRFLEAAQKELIEFERRE